MDNQLLQLRFEQLVEQVETMRLAQKAYFKNRTPEALQRAKSMEVMVDANITGCKNLLPSAEQNLFNQTTEA